MAQLNLLLLGGFIARDAAGQVIEISARKGRGLLAYLALQPGMTAPRERVAALLWSGRGGFAGDVGHGLLRCMMGEG